ncbi:MAG: TIGR02757 family protein [Balneolaceae bacterium]
MSSELAAYSSESLTLLRSWLNRLVEEAETDRFVHEDPVQFVWRYPSKREKEIAGFFSALLAWGRREIVCTKLNELFDRFGNEPYRFVKEYHSGLFSHLKGFRHRTFKDRDIEALVCGLQSVYKKHEDFESYWREIYRDTGSDPEKLLNEFRQRFFSEVPNLPYRTRKHIADPGKGSTCKRLCLLLKWFLRKGSPVDPGVWTFLSPAHLLIPMDVHVGRQSRRLGLLTRPSNDWKSVLELTDTLRKIDPADPSRFDIALFTIGNSSIDIPNRLLVNPHC